MLQLTAFENRCRSVSSGRAHLHLGAETFAVQKTKLSAPPIASQKLSVSAKSKRQNASGFTLIDTIIYVGLFSLITSFVLAVLFQIISGQNQHRNRIEIDAEANFMMQKMVWALTGAQTINKPAVNATSAVLSINKYNFSPNPIVFDVGSRNLRITKGTSTAVLLGNGRVYVSQLLLEHLPSANGASESVKIILGVASADITHPTASTTLKNTIYLKQ